MAGSTTEDLPCQATEDAKKMAILLASPSGEEPPEGPRRAAGGKPSENNAPQKTRARVTQPPPSPRGRPALPFYRLGMTVRGLSILPVDNHPSCGQPPDLWTTGQTTGPARRAGPVAGGDYLVPILIFMDVPFVDTTRMVVPVAGSFTPALGCSAYQYFLVSSNSGTAAWPRM